MRKSLLLTVAVLMTAASAGWALPPVELGDDCSYMMDIDTWGSVAVPALSIDTEDYETADLDGDGMPDAWQLGLLAAALCAGDAGLLAQWDANVEAINTFLAQFDPFNAAAGPLAAGYNALLPTLTAYYAAYGPAGLNVIPGPALPAFVLLLQGNVSPPAPKLADLGKTLNDAAGYTGLLPTFVPWFAAVLGCDTEQNAALNVVWDDFFGEFPGYGPVLSTYYTPALAGCAAVVSALPVPDVGPLTNAQLATALNDAAAATGTSAPPTGMAGILGALNVALPHMEIYGLAKAVGEPFSGLGDYDEDGVSNLTTYGLIVAAEGNRQAFVAAASGANVWYPGNPNLPVAGMIGLVALVGVTALGGGLVLRKK